MKAFATEDIRNIAVIGHGDAGKTQLVSSLLHVSGTTNRWGKVDEGTTVTDYDEDSISRKVTLNTNLASLEYKNTKINLLDTPGYAAFVTHSRPALRVADCALVVVDSVNGIEVQTEKTWSYANEFLLPRFMVINKLDKERSDFGHALDTAAESFARSIVPFTLPIGNEADFRGVVDVVHQKAYEFDKDGKAKEIPIPEEGRGLFDKTRERLIELVAESDDALLEKYFENGTLDEADIYPNLAKAIANSKLCPVYAVSAETLIGLSILLDHIVELRTAASEEILPETIFITLIRPANGSAIVRKTYAEKGSSLLYLRFGRSSRLPTTGLPNSTSCAAGFGANSTIWSSSTDNPTSVSEETA